MGGLLKNRVVTVNGHPDMTLAVDHGHKAMKQTKCKHNTFFVVVCRNFGHTSTELRGKKTGILPM